MEDSRVVRGGQGVGDADQQVEDLPPAARRRIPPCLQRSAVHELGDEVLTAGKFSGVVDREDVRMIESRRELRLALEAAPGAVVQGPDQKFDRDGAVQSRIGRAINHAHPAAAGTGFDSVVLDHGARREIGGRVRGGLVQHGALAVREQRFERETQLAVLAGLSRDEPEPLCGGLLECGAV
jgi:hypothetical protein